VPWPVPMVSTRLTTGGYHAGITAHSDGLRAGNE
jgi:hypothetical protein